MACAKAHIHGEHFFTTIDSFYGLTDHEISLIFKMNCDFHGNRCNSSLALYQCAKFHACIKTCTIRLKFRAKPPDYYFFEKIYLKFSHARISSSGSCKMNTFYLCAILNGSIHFSMIMDFSRQHLILSSKSRELTASEFHFLGDNI